MSPYQGARASTTLARIMVTLAERTSDADPAQLDEISRLALELGVRLVDGSPIEGPAATARVERFDRRGTEPFELFEPFEPFEFFQNSGIFPRKFKNFRKFQHFLNYRRNSDKISSKSEQKSVKGIEKY